MKTRLSTVAGFLTAATLLSGSAFAFAPEFTGDIPTVIITDRFTEPVLTDVFDAPNGAAGIAPRASSAFLFRYDNAIDAAGIVDVKDAGSLANVKVVFTEYTDELDLTPNTDKTLSINGKVAVNDFPLVAADFDSSVAFDLSDPLLDFRNIDFSPGTGLGPFDNVGDVTGDDLLVTYPQSRIVTMHLGSDNFTDRGSASDRSFMVVTDLDGGDRLTTPEATVIWDPVTAEGGSNPLPEGTGNFDGFTIYPNTLIAGFNTNGAWVAGGSYNTTSANFNGMAVTPAVSLVSDVAVALPDGTTAATLDTKASNNIAQTGILSFEKVANMAMTAGELYRVRVNASLTTAVQNADLYVQIGTTMTTGTATAGYKDSGSFAATTLQFPGLTTTASDVDAYILPKASIIADYNTFRAQLVDYNATAGATMTVNGVEIAVADGGLADLGTGTTVLNIGGAVTPATGEVVPPVGQTAFAAGTTPGQSIFLANDGSNAGMSSSASVTAAALVARMNTSATTGFWWEYQQFEVYQDIGGSLNLDNLDTGLTTTSNKLYALSVYAKTSAPNTVMPNLLPFVVYDYTGLAGVSYNVGNSDSLEPSLTPDPGVQLAVQDKAYTVVFSPETPNLEAKTQINVQLVYAGSDYVEGTTINITRIVLTSYVKPLD